MISGLFFFSAQQAILGQIHPAQSNKTQGKTNPIETHASGLHGYISYRATRPPAWKSQLATSTPRFDLSGKKITGVKSIFDTRIFEGNLWGLKWFDLKKASLRSFPQYYRHEGDKRIAVLPGEVPRVTGLLEKNFKLATPGKPFTAPSTTAGAGAWSKPGPVKGPFTVTLGDASTVTYSWYRFVDQPSFQQYKWSEAKRAKLQALVEKIHASWPIDRDYMPPPSSGELVALDSALFVTPPKALEIGYVPIVTRQESAKKN